MRGVRLSGWAPLVALVLVGCGAPTVPAVTPRPSSPATSRAAVRVPSDGVLLHQFGYRFGPLDSFSLPRTSVLSAAVDQADNVTLVLSTPSTSAVAGYLRRALPAAGFTITAGADPGGDTLTFTGNGWAGSVTGGVPGGGAGGGAGATGVLLRPR